MTSSTIASGSTAGQPRHTHTSVGGFCGVCGSVWPCKQATADSTPANLIPIARW